MARWSIALALVAAALPALSAAQEPPATYVPPTPALFSVSGGYRLAWPVVSGASRYAIRLGVTADDGTFIADDELANIDAGSQTFDVAAVLPHTEPLHCYRIRWRVYALIGTAAPQPPGEHSVRMCTDADNKSLISSLLPPTNVRVSARASGEPMIVWDWDLPTMNVTFEADVRVVRPDGSLVGVITLLPVSSRSALFPRNLPFPTNETCYGGIVQVNSVAYGDRSARSATATPVCFHGGRLYLPDAGAGPPVAHHPHLILALAHILAFAGTVAILAAIAGHRLARHR